MLSTNTGHNRNYDFDPYIASGYTRNRDIFFPQTVPIDGRLHPKDMVFGLAQNGQARAYPYELLERTGAVNDRFADQEILVFFDPDAELALGYLRQTEDQILHFEVADNSPGESPLFADIETGSTWNILGQGIDGPLAGHQLSPIVAYSAYWFGWASFWQDTEIWDGETLLPTEKQDGETLPPSAVQQQSWGEVKRRMR